jgi:ribosomal silencing factor RsfS
MKMTASTSETSVNFYQTTYRRRENLKSHQMLVLLKVADINVHVFRSSVRNVFGR